MQSLDYLHSACVVAVLAYMWRREPSRLLLTPVMLLGFVVLYGVGTIAYSIGTDTVPEISDAVTVCMILMWFGLVAGIELARASLATLAGSADANLQAWQQQPLRDDGAMDPLLMLLGLLVAMFILGTFIGLGKLGQLSSFLSFATTEARQGFRLEHGGQGGYAYQTLIASLAPFLSFLLLCKAAASRRLDLLAVGILLVVAVLAGKLGTFQKIPWLVYLLQLFAIYQAIRRLQLGLGRILLFTAVTLAGAAAAAVAVIPTLGAADIVEWILYRFFEINSEVVYQTFYVYPDHLPHTWGMNIGLVHSLFGNGELTSAHTEVANFFGAEGATFDAFFITDAWVDFSYPGVLIMSVLVGFVVKSVDILILSLGKTPLAIALLGAGLYGVFQLMVTSAFTAFLSGGLLFIPLLVLLAEGVVSDLRGSMPGE